MVWPDQEGLTSVYSAENGHAFLFELAAENTVHCGGVAESVLDALDLHGLIANDLHANVVALLVQAQMFKPKQDTHPAGAADAGDRERFATQIFGPLDVRSHYADHRYCGC